MPSLPRAPLAEAVFEIEVADSQGWSQLSQKALAVKLKTPFDGDEEVLEPFGMQLTLGREGFAVRSAALRSQVCSTTIYSVGRSDCRRARVPPFDGSSLPVGPRCKRPLASRSQQSRLNATWTCSPFQQRISHR